MARARGTSDDSTLSSRSYLWRHLLDSLLTLHAPPSTVAVVVTINFFVVLHKPIIRHCPTCQCEMTLSEAGVGAINYRMANSTNNNSFSRGEVDEEEEGSYPSFLNLGVGSEQLAKSLDPFIFTTTMVWPSVVSWASFLSKKNG